MWRICVSITSVGAASGECEWEVEGHGMECEECDYECSFGDVLIILAGDVSVVLEVQIC